MAQLHSHREESVNTALAMLLTRHGVIAQAESIHQSGKQRPDVMFTMGGVRVIIEGKYETVASAETVVLGDAQRRVASGICHIAVALVYADTLRITPTGDLEKVLTACPLRFVVISEAGQTEWTQATPAGLLASLRRVHQSLLDDDLVARAAQGFDVLQIGVVGKHTLDQRAQKSLLQIRLASGLFQRQGGDEVARAHVFAVRSGTRISEGFAITGIAYRHLSTGQGGITIVRFGRTERNSTLANAQGVVVRGEGNGVVTRLATTAQSDVVAANVVAHLSRQGAS